MREQAVLVGNDMAVAVVGRSKHNAWAGSGGGSFTLAKVHREAMCGESPSKLQKRYWNVMNPGQPPQQCRQLIML